MLRIRYTCWGDSMSLVVNDARDEIVFSLIKEIPFEQKFSATFMI